MYKKRARTNKNKRIINNSNKVIKGIKLFKSMIDNDEFKIPGEYYAKPNNNVDLDWMNDKIRYEETAEEVDTDYMKGNNDNELKLIKDFITKINNGTINKKSIEPEEKYEESIAERVKKRRQNTQRTFAPSSPPKKDYSEETANFLKNMEEEKKG